MRSLGPARPSSSLALFFLPTGCISPLYVGGMEQETHREGAKNRGSSKNIAFGVLFVRSLFSYEKPWLHMLKRSASPLQFH